MSNVTQLKTIAEPTTAELLETARRNGAARAVHTVKSFLIAEHKRISGEDSTAVKTATYAYETKLDDHELREKSEQPKAHRKILMAVCDLHWKTCDGKADRDIIAVKADEKKKARALNIEAFKLAEDELLQQRENTNQSTFEFMDSDDKGEAAGTLGNVTKPTTKVIYTSLLHLQETGVVLDFAQDEVLADLSGSGVDLMDLGMAPSEAVEHDEEEEEEEGKPIEIEDVFSPNT